MLIDALQQGYEVAHCCPLLLARSRSLTALRSLLDKVNMMSGSFHIRCSMWAAVDDVVGRRERGTPGVLLAV
jgi:hypothetical protein